MNPNSNHMQNMQNSQNSPNSKPPQNPQDKKPNIFGQAFKGFFKSLGTVLATFVMVGIITGCIVGSILTVYTLQSIGAEEPVDLESIKLGYTSKIFAKDSDTGEFKEIQQLYRPDSNRIYVEYDEISDWAKEAIVAVEDKRFWEHQGIDWRRTFGAFLGYLNLSSTKGGGSTIHQQLVKNVTGDDAYRVDRKMREIFRAIDLNKHYTHRQVLETYLNVVPFGAGTNGIESAANTYFGKSAKDLTLAESASIVGITKYPGLYNPFINPEENKKRQGDVLYFMHEQGRITDQEYEAALKEPLNFQKKQYAERMARPQSYFIDNVIEEVMDALVDKNGYSRSEAFVDLYENGYNVYITQDEAIQTHLETFYSTEPGSEGSQWPGLSIGDREYPQSAAVILDPDTGAIVGLVGGRGEKKDARTFNYATMAKRQPGSTFKAIGPYALAFEYDRVHWSYKIEDSPINPEAPPSEHYPVNYYAGYRGPVTVMEALRDSINTVAVKVGQIMTPQTIFDFLYNDLHMYSLVDDDINIAPMALGALTYGVTPLELAAAFQIFANGGLYTPPHAFTHVTDSSGRVVLEADTTPRRVLSEDTAVLMNKLLQQVVLGGTGTRAQIPNIPTGGKTGTADKDVDQWFVGFTPYYVANVWLGYELQNTYDKYGNPIPNSVTYYGNPYPTPPLFRSIMEPIHEGLGTTEENTKHFPESDKVIQLSYCTITGNRAGESCPTTAIGWYKESRTPEICIGPHEVAESDVEEAVTPLDSDGDTVDESPNVQGSTVIVLDGNQNDQDISPDNND